MAAAARAAERPRRLGSDANDLDTAGLLEHPLSADAAASPPDRLLGSEPSEDNEEEEPRAGRADAGQAPTRAAGPDAGPDADASLMGERGLEDSSLLDVLLGGAEEEEEDMLSPSPAASPGVAPCFLMTVVSAARAIAQPHCRPLGCNGASALTPVRLSYTSQAAPQLARSAARRRRRRAGDSSDGSDGDASGDRHGTTARRRPN
jgi:hypothetical protein